MEFGKIIKRSWEIISKYRFIWWLGLLAICAEGSGMTSFPSSGYNFNSNDLNSLTASFSPTESISPIANRIPSIPAPADPTFYIVIAIILIIGLAITAAIIYISNSASAGLVKTVQSIEGNKSINFSKAFHKGRKYFWRIFAVKILLALIMIGAVLVLISPLVIVVASPSIVTIILAVLVAIVAVIAIIPLALYLNILRILTVRIIVTKDEQVISSVSQARVMFGKNIGDILLSWLISIGASLIYGIGILVALVFVGGALIALGFLVWGLFKEMGAIIYALIAMFVVICACLFASGIFTSFISTYWTLVFNKLKE